MQGAELQLGRSVLCLVFGLLPHLQVLHPLLLPTLHACCFRASEVSLRLRYKAQMHLLFSVSRGAGFFLLLQTSDASCEMVLAVPPSHPGKLVLMSSFRMPGTPPVNGSCYY